MLATLTDYEIDALSHPLNMADGHAIHDCMEFDDVFGRTSELWPKCRHTTIPEAEQNFRVAFASLANSPAMKKWPAFKICPTASNSIDIMAAVLAGRKSRTYLIEPTFDNLALILKRRGIQIKAFDQLAFNRASEDGDLDKFLESMKSEAIFIVNPNNPTGSSIEAHAFRTLAQHCAEKRKILVIDNSFRFYNRDQYDDYRLLEDTGVSFMAMEDTGKVLPAYDIKASLLFCSKDLAPDVAAIYNELYLCTSPFNLLFLEQLVTRSCDIGLEQTLWRKVDYHRAMVRKSISGSAFKTDAMSVDSKISVEWIDCSETSLSDIQVTEFLKSCGLLVLPGRQFYWESGTEDRSQRNIRLALMKPSVRLRQSVDRLHHLLQSPPLYRGY